MKKYLKQLTIQNLQSHENTIIDFHPGLNMITGENGVGKSAIFRAIRFLAYNKPVAGVEKILLRKKKNSIIVKAVMDDDSWVLREKGKDVNRYVVYDDIIAKEYGGPLELNSIGITVPIEVSRILGMQLVSVSQNQEIEVNMATQNEPTFMLSNSSPEIARWVYSLTSLDKPRYCIDNINLDIKRGKEKVKDYNSRMEQLDAKLKTFAKIGEHETKLVILEDNDIYIGDELVKTSVLNEILDNMILLKAKAIPTTKRVDELQDGLGNITDEIMADLNDQITTLFDLSAIYEMIIVLEQNIATLQSRTAILDKIGTFQEDDVNDVLASLNIMIDIKAAVEKTEEKIKNISSEISELDEKMKKDDKKLENIKSKIFKNKNCCPICGSQIDTSLMEHIIEELDNDQTKS